MDLSLAAEDLSSNVYGGTRSMCYALVLLLLIVCGASADDNRWTQQYKTCKDIACPVIDQPSPDAGSKSFHWLTAGLPYIFWSAVADGELFRNSSHISKACRHQLQEISHGIANNDKWSYQFPDSSGKAAPGILRSTFSNYGHYDQCLSIETHGMHGKYCMLDMYHTKVRQQEEGKLSLSTVSLWNGFPQFSSLCLPDACHGKEIQLAVHKILPPYGITVAGVVHCDTRESISYSKRMSSLTNMQLASIVLVSGLIFLVTLSTMFHAYTRMYYHSTEVTFLTSMSMIESSRKLFYSKPWTFDILVFDLLKTNIIFLGSAVVHIMTCIEAMLAPATLSNQRVLHSIETPLFQNDSGLLGLPFLTGIATFTAAYPLARNKKLPYAAAVFDRIVRFVPALVLTTACEFIWPILGSGPLYTRTADFNLDKCERNWWMNLLFINNFLNAIEICSGQSYWSSVDMQLFLMGLVAVYFFSRSERQGTWFCIMMMVYGLVKTAFNAATMDTGFALIDRQPHAHRVLTYFTHIHMATSSYITPYFAGMLLAYMRSEGRLIPDLGNSRRKAAFFLLSWAAFFVVTINCNNVQNYPYHLRWLYMSINRTFQLLGNVLQFTFFMSLKEFWEEGYCKEYQKQGITFSPFKAIARLCFPLYLCNFLYVRMEFFTRRFLAPSGGFWIFKSTLSSVIIVYVFSLLFHLFFLAPLDAVRENLMSPKHKKKEAVPFIKTN